MSHDATKMQDLYRELILDHARQPRNFKRLAHATHSAEGINPLCGDKLHLYLVVDQGNIAEIGFQGSGCAISMASASLLTETVAARSAVDAETWFAAVTRRLSSEDDEVPENLDFSKIRALDGVRQYPSRVKCATLAWHALHAALNQAGTPATTE